jgi:flagellar biosynthetic protein FliR
MTDPLQTQLFTLFLLFCRIGGCCMMAPGMSSARIPVHVRLFAALAVTAALAPLLQAEMSAAVGRTGESVRPLLILSETLIGATIGTMARLFFLALQFAATAISTFIGLAGIPGVPLEEADTGSPLATLVSTGAVMFVFTMGLHVELLRGVLDSYRVLPPGGALPITALMNNMVSVLGESFTLALRLSAPFLAYGVIVNFALGIGNRFAPHLSVYHATTGVVILGGFLLFYVMWVDWILVFAGSYRAWLVQGGF